VHCKAVTGSVSDIQIEGNVCHLRLMKMMMAIVKAGHHIAMVAMCFCLQILVILSDNLMKYLQILNVFSRDLVPLGIKFIKIINKQIRSQNRKRRNIFLDLCDQ
jgi:hypothetical protein